MILNLALKLSPPSRVEWIEIPINLASASLSASPPSRVEWIEINGHQSVAQRTGVSAFAGGVD